MKTLESGSTELVLGTQRDWLGSLTRAAEAAAVTRIHSSLVVGMEKTLGAGSVEASTLDGRCWSVSWKDMFVPEPVWDV